MSLGCPSVARWRSHRRLRNGLCEPSISPRRTSSLQTSKAHVQRSAVSAPRRLTGTRGFRKLTQVTPTVATSKSTSVHFTRGSRRQRRPLKPRERPQARTPKSRRTKSVQSGSDRHEPSMSLGCPSVGRRRSRRRLRNGLCEPSISPRRTSSLRTSKAHVQRSAVSAPRRLTGTRGFCRLVQVTPTITISKSTTTLSTRGSGRGATAQETARRAGIHGTSPTPA